MTTINGEFEVIKERDLSRDEVTRHRLNQKLAIERERYNRDYQYIRAGISAAQRLNMQHQAQAARRGMHPQQQYRWTEQQARQSSYTETYSQGARDNPFGLGSIFKWSGS